MKTATVQLQSITNYSQSRPHDTPKLNKETSVDYEERTWKERLHTDGKGMVFIPPMSLKNAISEAAKYLSIQIPGKGKSTYTKHFEAGVIPLDQRLYIDKHKDEIEGERLFLNADGRRGSGTRVWKTYPLIENWEVEAQFAILDDIITEPVFRHVIESAGQIIGIGRWRPRNNGLNGRFKVGNIDWVEG